MRPAPQRFKSKGPGGVTVTDRLRLATLGCTLPTDYLATCAANAPGDLCFLAAPALLNFLQMRWGAG